MPATANTYRDAVELLSDGVRHDLSPDEARELAVQLTASAADAERFDDFDDTPGTLYRDANGDRALFVVTPHPWDEHPEYVLYRIPFDADEGATWSPRENWEGDLSAEDRGKKFVRVKTMANQPLNADGSLF